MNVPHQVSGELRSMPVFLSFLKHKRVWAILSIFLCICLQQITRASDTGIMQKAIIPGYDTFRFFMDEDTVKKLIQDGNYLPKDTTLIERVEDVYVFNYISQSFIYFSEFESRYYCFDFFKGIEKLKRIKPTEVYHLTARFAQNFKIITAPAGAEKNKPAWEHSFIFFHFENKEYKLFAVVLSYIGDTKIGEFNQMSDFFFASLQEKLQKTYGTPNHTSAMPLDGLTTKHFINYKKGFVQEPEYKIGSQINVSYVVFGGTVANYQVTYLTSDYLIPHTIKNLHRKQYTDIVSADELIEF